MTSFTPICCGEPMTFEGDCWRCAVCQHAVRYRVRRRPLMPKR